MISFVISEEFKLMKKSSFLINTSFPITIEPDSFSLFCDGKSWTSGFPSGHAARAAMFAFVLVYVLSERFPKWSHIIWLYPLLIAFSRIYVLQHYPLDVLVGMTFGGLFGWIFYRLQGILQRRFVQSN